MSDRLASESDTAFREALDALEREVEVWAIGRRACDVPAARARVLALYAERQGEAGTVTEKHEWLEWVGEALIPHHELSVKFVGDSELRPGDKVRVTKVEEGQ